MNTFEEFLAETVARGNKAVSPPLHKDLYLNKEKRVGCKKCRKPLQCMSLTDNFAGAATCPKCKRTFSHDDSGGRNDIH